MPANTPFGGTSWAAPRSCFGDTAASIGLSVVVGDPLSSEQEGEAWGEGKHDSPSWRVEVCCVRVGLADSVDRHQQPQASATAPALTVMSRSRNLPGSSRWGVCADLSNHTSRLLGATRESWNRCAASPGAT